VESERGVAAAAAVAAVAATRSQLKFLFYTTNSGGTAVARA